MSKEKLKSQAGRLHESLSSIVEHASPGELTRTQKSVWNKDIETWKKTIDAPETTDAQLRDLVSELQTQGDVLERQMENNNLQAGAMEQSVATDTQPLLSRPAMEGPKASGPKGSEESVSVSPKAFAAVAAASVATAGVAALSGHHTVALVAVIIAAASMYGLHKSGPEKSTEDQEQSKEMQSYRNS